MNKKKAAFFGAWVLMLLILIVLVFRMGTPGTQPTASSPARTVKIPPPPDKTVLTKNWSNIMAFASPVRGKADAPYSLVEFGDFECPLCGQERTKIEAFVSKMPMMNMYFVNRPFSVHAHALPAAQAALSAASLHKFWPMYDALYAHQKQLDTAHFETFADQIGIDGKKVADDVNTNTYLKKVQDSEKFCDQIGVNATPTIVIRNNQNGSLTIARTDDEITRLVHDPHWTALARKAAEKSTKVAHE